jgi:tetratricopeptide (TPR) repeat protein
VAVVTAAAFIIVLIVATVISIRESIQAKREAAVAQAVNDYLQREPDPDLRVRTALDRAAERVGGKFSKQPELEAAIRDTIGETYKDLGQFPQARQQLERTVEVYRRVLGAENPKTLRAMSELGYVIELQGKYDEAEALVSRTLEIQRRVLGPEHPDTLASMNLLAVNYHNNIDTLSAMANLARSCSSQSKYAQAETLINQALEIERRVFGAEHPPLGTFGLLATYTPRRTNTRRLRRFSGRL